MDKINDKNTFEELLNDTMKEIKVGQIIKGKIIEKTAKKEIFVDLGYKADGIIPVSEYQIGEDENAINKFKIGDEITAVVLKLNDGIGNVLLSYKRARFDTDKQEFAKKVEKDEIFSGIISEVNDKGIVVYYNTIKIFIPMSLSGILKSEDPYTFKGKEVKFKIIEFVPEKNRIIGSVRIVKEAEKNKALEEFWNNIEISKEYEGTVVNISDYGAFVEIVSGVQGLLHVSEMTWERNVKPQDLVKVGQKIKVTVKELDKENKKIKLSFVDKGPNPWDVIAEKYKVTDVVTVEISNMMPFGAFAKIENGIEGLIHISQICEKRINKPEEVLKIGQKVNAKIINLDKENKKIELSIRELEGTSEELIEE